MKKLLLITLVAVGLAFASAPRSDAQVYFSVGFGPGYYGYYPYGYYSRTAITSRTTMGVTHWYGGHRYYRHYRHHHDYWY
jgi:hypothetical protein